MYLIISSVFLELSFSVFLIALGGQVSEYECLHFFFYIFILIITCLKKHSQAEEHAVLRCSDWWRNTNKIDGHFHY